MDTGGMTYVGIPSIGLAPQLTELVAGLHEEQVIVEVFVNGDREDLARVVGLLPRHSPVRVEHCQGENLYAMWGEMMDRAERVGVPACAILNDDIGIARGSVTVAARWLAGLGIVSWDPFAPPSTTVLEARHVEGTYREGGIAGFAFVCRPDVAVRPDPGFGWWGGDDDLVWAYNAAGFGAARLVGLGVEHQSSTSANARPEVYAGCAQDRERLLAKWGKAW